MIDDIPPLFERMRDFCKNMKVPVLTSKGGRGSTPMDDFIILPAVGDDAPMRVMTIARGKQRGVQQSGTRFEIDRRGIETARFGDGDSSNSNEQ